MSSPDARAYGNPIVSKVPGAQRVFAAAMMQKLIFVKPGKA
jgi:hypothetical protein